MDESYSEINTVNEILISKVKESSELNDKTTVQKMAVYFKKDRSVTKLI